MSGKVSGLVWDLDMRALVEQARKQGRIPADSRIEPQPLRTVLLALADHADHNGRNVYPGVELLAWKTELTMRNVQRHLSVLRDLGILIAVRYAKGGRGHATEYRLDFDRAPRKPPVHTNHDANDTLAQTMTPPTPISSETMTPASPFTSERVTPQPERVTFSAERVTPQPERVSVASPQPSLTVIVEPSVNRQRTSRGPARAFTKIDERDLRFCEGCGRNLTVAAYETHLPCGKTDRRRPETLNGPERRCEECEDVLDAEHPPGLRVCFGCYRRPRTRTANTVKAEA